ncbi:MAG: hypothetical protein H0X25_07390 [Acidobacteriales bacterium]|nr:hypothetical protein [Terriglobales bacterium]
MRPETDDWISMEEGARRAGITGHTAARKFRARIKAINADHGGKLLRSTGSGKKKPRLEVSAQALLFYQRVDTERRDAEVMQLQSDVEELRGRQEALRQQFLAFRRKSHDWFMHHPK